MKIGIQISSGLKQKTGVEEYIYQLLRYLPKVDDFKNHQFFVYDKRSLKWPFKFGWTQIRLGWEMLKNKPDILFVPAHTYPLIHPKFVVAIQGLEFEAVPETYGFIKRKILRFLTKRNAKKAEKIIVPSQNTKNDLIKYYKINPEKIFVVYHGVNKIQNSKFKIQNYADEVEHPRQSRDNSKFKNYILYLGSSHRRKNIDGFKKAYKVLKEKYRIEHELILAGVEKYISEEEKLELLKNADVFVFPSFYEGFGLPVLEAQVVGTPVVASNTSSLPEILGNSALLVNPKNPEEIAEAIYKIIANPDLKENLIKKGQENVKRFSWLKCAEETLKIITL